MQQPSAVFPVQEAIQFSESLQCTDMPSPTNMPGPDPGNLKFWTSGLSSVLNGQGQLTDETLGLLRIINQKIEATIQQQPTGPQFTSDISTTTVSQPTDDCDGFPSKEVNSNTKPHVHILSEEVVSHSVEENTPTEPQKPWFGQVDVNTLSDILERHGIKDFKQIEETEQVTLGVDVDCAETQNTDSVPEFVTSKLPCLEVFEGCKVDEQKDFELDLNDVDEVIGNQVLTKQVDPLWTAEIKKPEIGSVEYKQADVNLGPFQRDFSHAGPSDDDDMGPYREPPPSVGSVVSNSTYTSDFSVRSPRPDLEAFEESSVAAPAPGKVSVRRSSKRRVSGGKDIKRLVSGGKDIKRLSCGPKALLSSSGKPYPPASTRNGKLSRMMMTDYSESMIHEHWWEMLRNVEKIVAMNIDVTVTKVETLRKYCHDLFAVAMYKPANWGNNQKRKGIYKKSLATELYNWDPRVPFCSLNNGPKNTDSGDAPRAKKDDLVRITPYLIERYMTEVRPHIRVWGDDGHLGSLPPLELVNTREPEPYSAPIVPKQEPVDTMEETPSEIPELVTSIPTEAFCVNLPTEVSACDTIDIGTLDVKALKSMGIDLLMASNESPGNLGVKTRQNVEQMDVDEDLLLPNPEFKKTGSSDEPSVKVKLEHSYSMPGDDDVVKEKVSAMTTYQDTALPGTVLHVADNNFSLNTQIQATANPNTNGDEYWIQKLAEMRPDLFGSVLNVIDAQIPAN